jgi:hypothetical protein
MTDAEQAAWARQVRWSLRDERVRRGTRTPRTMREMTIYLDAQAEKDEHSAGRIARAERRQQQSGTRQA